MVIGGKDHSQLLGKTGRVTHSLCSCLFVVFPATFGPINLNGGFLPPIFLFLCNKPINYLLIVGDLLYCLRLGFCFLVLFSWLPQRPFNSYRRWFSTHIILHMGFLVRVHVHFFFPRFSRGLLYSRSSSNRDYNLLYTVKKITRNLKAGRSALMIWV